MAQPDPEPVFPVGFDEDAVNEDLKRLPESAATALESFRRELARNAASVAFGEEAGEPIHARRSKRASWHGGALRVERQRPVRLLEV